MTTSRGPVRIPRAAEALRVPLWQRSQQRMREKYGFDMDAADAVDRARALAAGRPDDPEPALLLGSVLATRGETGPAEAEVRRALEIAPRLPRAHTTLATLQMQRGDREEALRSARNAAALDSEDPTVLYNLGLAEWFAGERSTARAAFERAAEALRALTGEPPPAPPWWRRLGHRG
ncbi:MAG TPA: tetratricopeptide repeat protein [Candidatus Dormibacteraeota bacterium]|jgi:tetratricopeptide (TPR) repeat protein